MGKVPFPEAVTSKLGIMQETDRGGQKRIAEGTVCTEVGGWRKSSRSDMLTGVSKDRVQSLRQRRQSQRGRKGPGPYVHIKEFRSVLREMRGYRGFPAGSKHGGNRIIQGSVAIMWGRKKKKGSEGPRLGEG